jgi:hypothetical protein
MNPHQRSRLTGFLIAALFGGACILPTAAPAGTPPVSIVTATPDSAAQGQAPEKFTATFTPVPTRIPTATFTPSLTATLTTAPVTMTAGQALSCVKGPDWKLYEGVAGIADGETVALVARAVTEIPDYYVVRKSDGTECWAFGGSSTISGSAASLPVRETPPLPTVSFVISNKLQIPLCFVYIRGKHEVVWGANRLADPVAINGAVSIPITAGYYDVMIKDCQPAVIYEEHDRAIGSDPAYRNQELAFDVEFFIRNNYPFSICHIHFRTLAISSWEDLFNHDNDGGPFAMGALKKFILRAGLYNMRITRCNGFILPLTTLYIRPGVGGFTWA